MDLGPPRVEFGLVTKQHLLWFYVLREERKRMCWEAWDLMYGEGIVYP